MPFPSPAGVKNILARLSLRKPKRSHQQDEDSLPLIDNPSSKAVPLLNEINDKLQSSRAWSPRANTGRDWISHPFVAWVAEQSERKGDGWLRKVRLFQKGSGRMRLAEKVFVERIHAALFGLKNCFSETGLYKLLNAPMRCAMGLSPNGCRMLYIFLKPPDFPDSMESPSQSEEGPDLQEPRNLFENASQFLPEEERQDGYQDDGPAALPLEHMNGGENSTASVSELVALTEISKDDFDAIGSGRQQCAAGMRLYVCDGRYFLCPKKCIVKSVPCHLQKTRIYAVPSGFDV